MSSLIQQSNFNQESLTRLTSCSTESENPEKSQIKSKKIAKPQRPTQSKQMDQLLKLAIDGTLPGHKMLLKKLRFRKNATSHIKHLTISENSSEHISDGYTTCIESQTPSCDYTQPKQANLIKDSPSSSAIANMNFFENSTIFSNDYVQPPSSHNMLKISSQKSIGQDLKYVKTSTTPLIIRGLVQEPNNGEFKYEVELLGLNQKSYNNVIQISKSQLMSINPQELLRFYESQLKWEL